MTIYHATPKKNEEIKVKNQTTKQGFENELTQMTRTEMIQKVREVLDSKCETPNGQNWVLRYVIGLDNFELISWAAVKLSVYDGYGFNDCR